MEDRDISILTQVAYKEANENARALNLNLTVPEHRAVYEEMFSFLTESLFDAVNTKLTPNVAERVAQHFQGSTVVQMPQPQPPVAAGQGQQYQQPQTYGGNVQPMTMPANYGAPQGPFGGNTATMAAPRIKGQNNGQFPDWALAAFAERGWTEVYDNRHMLQTKPKLPWFKDTASGDGLWPPDSFNSR